VFTELHVGNKTASTTDLSGTSELRGRQM